jgi:hypothetical protein
VGRWSEADVAAYSAACRTEFSPAACGCLLAELEAYYDDLDELREDESEARALSAFRRCGGLLTKQ